MVTELVPCVSFPRHVPGHCPSPTLESQGPHFYWQVLTLSQPVTVKHGYSEHFYNELTLTASDLHSL